MSKNIIFFSFCFVATYFLANYSLVFADIVQNQILQNQLQLDDLRDDENDLFNIVGEDFKEFLSRNFLGNKLYKAKLSKSLIIDNFDNRVFGRERLNSNIQLKNLWSGDGSLTINSNVNQEAVNHWLANLHRKNNFNFGNNVEFQIPANNYQLNYRHQNQYYQYYGYNNNILEMKQGLVITNRLSFNYAIINNKKSKTFLRNSIRIRNSTIKKNGNNEIDKSFNSTIIGIGFSQLFNNNNYELFIKPTFYRGTTMLSARKDSKFLDINRHNQFNLLDININFTQKLQQNFNQKIVLNGQISNKILYSNEQISIGGVSSVRGFESDSVSGDSGFFINYEISSPLKNILPFANCIVCSNIKNTIFFDYGKVYDLTKKQQISANSNQHIYSLAGAGFGWQLNHKLNQLISHRLIDNRQELNWQYMVAMPIKKSDALSRKVSPVVFYLRVLVDL